MTQSADAPPHRPLPLILAMAPLLVLLAAICSGVALFGFGGDMLIVAMMIAALVAGIIAKRQGAGWTDIQTAAGAKLGAVLPAVLILLGIGILLGAWMFSGTIPLMVAGGIALIDPRYMALTAFLGTAMMSMMTGTSWGSAGTLGVAFMATATALGIPLAPVAGAVVSGAYFGDKMSPLSDTTNIAAIAAGAPLLEHVHHMLYTAVPSFVVAGMIYAALGLFGGAPALTDGGAGIETVTALNALFHLDLWCVLPILVAVGGIAWRQPPALVILASAVLALVIGVADQGFAARDAVILVMRGFDVSMTGADPASLPASLPGLLNRGGLASMAETLIFIITAFLLAGAMEASGALSRLLTGLLAGANSVWRLIAATMLSGTVMVSVTSHAGVTALIVGELFRPAFKRLGLAPVNLSRSIEDSATIVEPLLPWTVSALFMATTLGVPTLEYAPWAFFCVGGPIMSLSYAVLAKRWGFGIRLLPDMTG
tara:strand:+ start:3716 stop:5167 length:1452 start_codon:yes stop_codon:yes gene_type:complete